MAHAATYDRLIRDIYLHAPRGPLRVAVGEGSYRPFLEPGDTAILDRTGAAAARAGEFVGVKDADGELRLLRFLARTDALVTVLAPSLVEEVPADRVVGRVTEVVRGGRKHVLDAARPRATLLVDQAVAHARRARRRVRLQATLGSLYWRLIDAFEEGVSETGDLLITDRCSVGCRFCIYSCVPAGHDMDVAITRQASAALRAAGVPRVRLLGGEPFHSVPHLVRSFRAVRESYDPDRIIILTSGYFGTRDDLVQAKMDPLVAEGLRHLHLSFDVFHLEQYPASCYERVLAYAAAHGLTSVLVVHYSSGLAAELDRLLALRERFPFDVRVTTVSREGDAKRLKRSETSVAGFDRFRDWLDAGTEVRVQSEDPSCFRWTVFPSGDVHFCCKQNEESRVGNLNRDRFADLQDKLRGLTARNRLNVLRFATCHTGEVSGNPCLTCPLRAGS